MDEGDHAFRLLRKEDISAVIFLLFIFISIKSRDSVVRIATGYGLED
jgi:hypothetical protein